MGKYNSFISSSIKKKYTNSAVYNKKFLYYFFESRSSFIKKVLKIRKKEENKDKLLSFLKKIAQKNKILKKDEKKIIKLYKKFNIHLKISWKNKKKTNPKIYVYLAYLVLRTNKINKLQQLNFLMKIIDKLILEKKINFEANEKLLIKKLITFEKQCIKRLQILA